MALACTKLSRKKKIILACVTAVVLIAVAVVLALLLTPPKSGSEQSSSTDGSTQTAPSPAPTSPPPPTAAPENDTTTTTLPPSSNAPTSAPTFADTLTTFCVVGDAPYTENEALNFPLQIASIPSDCEFVINIGDIKDSDSDCTEEDYKWMRDKMLLSVAPSLIVLGDNEWNDCTDMDAAFALWTKYFVGFEGNWTHSLNIERKSDRLENFYFVHRGTLFIGLNIVGPPIRDDVEWSTRLKDLYFWTAQLINQEVVANGRASGVVIMAHAEPKEQHDDFFVPLTSFISITLKNEYPILYLHGDGHEWTYTTDFFDQPSFLGIMHEGGTRNPALKIMADPVGRGPNVTAAFWYDRQLT